MASLKPRPSKQWPLSSPTLSIQWLLSNPAHSRQWPLSSPTHMISLLKPRLIQISAYGRRIVVHNFDLERVFPFHDHKYYVYAGSRSVPGCEENVQRIVFPTPIGISQFQVTRKM